MSRMGQMTVCKKPYGGWPNCYWLTNGRLELVVTTDVGPRIIRFGFVGEANVLREYPKLLGRSGGAEWLIYGGHRLWEAPEDPARTYQPDNAPVVAAQQGQTLAVTQAADQVTQTEKSIELRFGSAGQVVVTHRLTNRSHAPVQLAPWAITVMDEGGVAIVPLPPRGVHPESLSASSILTLWPYTDLSDSRWTWGQRYILLRQTPSATLPQKIGASTPDRWVGYANGGRLLVKTFRREAGACYPDMGANVEVFTNGTMLEVETLGPLEHMAPGEAAEHTEEWFLFRDVPDPRSDDEVDRFVLPRVQEALNLSRSG